MTKETKKPNGSAVAAMMSAAFSVLVLALVHTGTFASSSFKDWVLSIGKLWVPGAEGIGPYSGKETFMLVAWFGSWIVLHLSIRKKNVNVTLWANVFMILVALATLLVWTPILDLLFP